MAKKPKRKVYVPTSLQEAAGLLEKYGLLELEKAALQTELEERIASWAIRFREKARGKLTPLEEQLADYVLGLQAFANEHRKTLPTDKNKTITLDTGELYWRDTPPKVSTGKTKEEIIIKRIQALAKEPGKENYPDRYLRTVISLDKEALLKDKPAIAGVSYPQREVFYVKANNGSAEVKAAVETVTA